MPIKMNHALDLHTIVEAGFPISDYHKEILKGDVAFEIELEIAFDSMGSSGNGWDDPGEGAEWYVERVWCEKGIESLFPLTTEQTDWLNSYDKLNDEVQQWAADSSNWYEPYDD